eukprot:gnl/TRDRNA2_/TRDRNA2_174728_c1_seq3.p1 gnl/TRDRNA2_/TRDRNA2_174728_c1~~gnl/TRDRNA2_/TRDRNA2_174728_c1_seq3.p1  ORF type:complete len:134 (+),score=20.15 gnl/TRDRNA2_/TRDRNA2_174728_c1_seq3:370-771(+)
MAALLSAVDIPEKQQRLLCTQPARAHIHCQQLQNELVALRRAAEVWLWVDLGAMVTSTPAPLPAARQRDARVLPTLPLQSLDAGDANEPKSSAQRDDESDVPRANVSRPGAPPRPSLALTPRTVMVVAPEGID